MGQTSFRFRSNIFAIDPREDEETNPFFYGRSLAEWLRERFTQHGYEPEEIIPEDWGWCVVLRRTPFLLSIACGNETNEMLTTVNPEQKSAFVPDPAGIWWRCFVVAESPIWTGYFWKQLLGRVSPAADLEAAERQLEATLRAEAGIHDLEVESDA